MQMQMQILFKVGVFVTSNNSLRLLSPAPCLLDLIKQFGADWQSEQSVRPRDTTSFNIIDVISNCAFWPMP